MKLSDQIRRIRRASEIDQSEVLGPGGEEIDVDNAEEDAAPKVVSDSDKNKLQQGKTVPDTGFLTAEDKHLLRKHGYQIVALDYVDEMDKQIQRDLDKTVNAFLARLKQEIAQLKKTYKDPKKIKAVLQGRYDFLTDKIFKKLGL